MRMHGPSAQRVATGLTGQPATSSDLSPPMPPMLSESQQVKATKRRVPGNVPFVHVDQLAVDDDDEAPDCPISSCRLGRRGLR